MADGTHWPRTWLSPAPEHSKGDHSGIMQVMLKHPSNEPLQGHEEDAGMLYFSDVDIRLPMLVCVSREKCPGYDHKKKAGTMNLLIRALTIMSNGPFILSVLFISELDFSLQESRYTGLTHQEPKNTTQVAVATAIQVVKRIKFSTPEEIQALRRGDSDDEDMNLSLAEISA